MNFPSEENKNQVWRARMMWSSRRGMLEMDYYLQAFLAEYPVLSEQDKLDYERLLNFGDNQIFSWLTKQSEPEDDTLLSILAKIRNSAKKLSQKNKNQSTKSS